ncbi:MAG: PEP-CTERM sorting domain-containing protein, partial [Opitutales bacterium]
TLIDPNFVTNITLAHGETGFESVTGEVVGSGPSAVVDLFAVSYTLGDADPDGLYSITDNLDATSETGEEFTELESSNDIADGNDVFKSVSFAPVPEPGSYALIFGGLGAVLALVRRRRALCARTS